MRFRDFLLAAGVKDALDTAPPSLDLSSAEESVGDIRVVREGRVLAQQVVHYPALRQDRWIPHAQAIVIHPDLHRGPLRNRGAPAR